MEKKIDNNRIELRSEKVQKIIGNIPSSLVNAGIILIIIILITLLGVLFFSHIHIVMGIL